MSRPNDPLLPPGSIDVAFLCDTVHEIGGRVDYYRKVYRALKARGRLAVIEPLPAPNMGAGEHVEGGQVSRELTVREAQEAGFRLIAEPKFLPRQYFLIFQQAKDARPPAPN